MKVTRDLIFENTTLPGAAGGWTRAQIEALGIPWPPKQGWIEAMDGLEIPDSQWAKFVSGKAIGAKKLWKMKKIAQRHPGQIDLGL